MQAVYFACLTPRTLRFHQGHEGLRFLFVPFMFNKCGIFNGYDRYGSLFPIFITLAILSAAASSITPAFFTESSSVIGM